MGNFSSSPRPTLPAGDYLVSATVRNASSTRNPSGVKIEFFQGTTSKWLSPFIGETAAAVATDLTWTAQADFRFSVQYSKAEIWDVQVLSYGSTYLDGTTHHQLMEGDPNCTSDRIDALSVDDAEGVRYLYSSLATSTSFTDDVACNL